MSRRPGQDGYEEVKGNWYHARFRIDVAGQEIRKYKSVPICPVSGPGALGKLERLRKRREIIQASGADTEEHFNHVQSVNLGTTFRAQARWWLEHMQTRTRKPIMPNTASGWQQVLDNWLNPSIGDVPLAEVGNRTLKEVVAKMVREGLSAKSINNYIQVLKMVVASAVDEDGDELYPKRWNHDFADVPLIEGQHTPEFTGEEVSAVVANASGRFRMLYALLGGSGARIGEALGLRIERISKDRTSIEIEEQVQEHRLQPTKTRASVRVVDIHHELARMLNGFIGDRKAGFLFCTSSGRPMSDDNVYRRFYPLLKRLGIETKGFHAFRRFRNTHLSEKDVPDRLIQFWMGHKDRTMTDRYTKLKRAVSFRKAWAERAGLGFSLPEGVEVAPNAPKIDTLELAVVA